jgi:hypothetical protein
LKGEFPEEARPDKLGVIFAQSPVQIRGQPLVIIAQETRLGVTSESLPWALIQGLVKAGNRVVIGPPVDG